ncbi:MAG: SAM-dependent methyltransferase [Longicatena sp.]
MLYIVGLGASDENQIPYGVIKKLEEGLPLYLRTQEHPMVSFLKRKKIPYTSFDDVYVAKDSFEEVYEVIINTLKEASNKRDIIYAVPGHPSVAEYAVKVLMRESNAIIVGGQSFLDSMFASLNIDPIDGLQIMDALSFDVNKVVKGVNLIVPQVFDQLSASDLKLDLMELFDDEYPVCIVKSAGSSQEQVQWMHLYELDRSFELSNLTTVFVPASAEILSSYQMEK